MVFIIFSIPNFALGNEIKKKNFSHNFAKEMKSINYLICKRACGRKKGREEERERERRERERERERGREKEREKWNFAHFLTKSFYFRFLCLY